MSKVKNVVKVMNFHSLLRVDSSKREANKLFMLEHQLSLMIDIIMNNKNFILDKKKFKINDKAEILNIYIGSDYGFCSNYNSQVNAILSNEDESSKILIGKKVTQKAVRVLKRINKDDYLEHTNEIESLIEKYIYEGLVKEINIIYNHYENSSTIYLVKKKVFPIDIINTEEQNYSTDFVVETDINILLKQLTTLYVLYELRICLINAGAAENILRQNTTSESLKKIDEIEDYDLKKYRKDKKSKEFRKVIENFRKLRD